MSGKTARQEQIAEADSADPASQTLPQGWKSVRDPAWGEAASNRGTENLFVQLLGKTQAEVDEKLALAVHRFFAIGTDEPNTLIRDTGYRLYYELPQDPSMAFIWAADSNDIRSEGMSYGMMLAVQMGLHEQFDRLWKFARTYMQFPSDSPLSAWHHYFRWQGNVRMESPEQWAVKFGPQTTPAPDGEEYFATALYLAHRRWGSTGEVDYRNEAAKISWALLHNRPQRDGRFPIINPQANMVVFVPYQSSNDHSDPSYHLPAFYDLFAQDGPEADRARWTSIAEESRAFLVLSAHPTTGLHPDYAGFDGVGVAGGDQHEQFRYDAWRVVMNMAVDYAWFSRDRDMRLQVEKYHEFFSTRITEDNVQGALFQLDGTAPATGDGGSSTALTATLAAGSLASRRDDRARFVNAAWNVGQQQGQFRYYQEAVYLLGLLNAAGKFNHTF